MTEERSYSTVGCFVAAALLLLFAVLSALGPCIAVLGRLPGGVG